MWLCETCYDPKRHKPFGTNARVLVCVECKRRKRCFLVIRRSDV